ncbi:hypothetical protein [Hymenobacter chitinivorans]|nr:hypothetical protein [Hymenobacter chitinivorans]
MSFSDIDTDIDTGEPTLIHTDPVSQTLMLDHLGRQVTVDQWISGREYPPFNQLENCFARLFPAK